MAGLIYYFDLSTPRPSGDRPEWCLHALGFQFAMVHSCHRWDADILRFSRILRTAARPYESEPDFEIATGDWGRRDRL